MVNDDLTWDLNSPEQQLSRIHRICQIEVRHLWKLLAGKTREWYVRIQLVEKSEEV